MNFYMQEVYMIIKETKTKSLVTEFHSASGTDLKSGNKIVCCVEIIQSVACYYYSSAKA